MGLEDGAIGVAGLDCIRAFLADESWCSFGNVDDDRRRGGDGGLGQYVGVVARTRALGETKRGSAGALAVSGSNRDVPGCVWPLRICAEQCGGDRRLPLPLRQCQCGTADGAATGGSAGADAKLGYANPADELDVCQVLQGGGYRRAAES